MQDFTPEPIDAALDAGYNARASVASFETEHARYVAASEAVKASCRMVPDLVYDELSGEKLDLYPAAEGAPLFLWIHGGYWRASSKDDNAFVVPGLLAHGIAVAVIDYTLAPAVPLDEIVSQVRKAVAWLHTHAESHGVDARRLHVGGSSAGGHLTGMLLAGGWAADFGLPEDVIDTALTLSGLFELDPLRFTHINAWARLDEAAAARNSPLRLIPERSAARLIASVGGLETPAFKAQTADYVSAWEAAGHSAQVIDMPEHNHFDIALSLGDPAGVLANAVARSIMGA